MKIHHIGYLVKEIDKAIEEFKKLGFIITIEKCFDGNYIADFAFLQKDGYCVELICPVNDKSPIYGLMKKHKNSPYHICYEVDNIEQTINDLIKQGYLLFKEIFSVSVLNNKRFSFLMNSHIGMIELTEKKDI
ncbi:MAG: VOC family protein [Endomicrobium sp.]|jgi:methylmalonyl-CoA/ethylmalonyl-CoA epimerase|nr:VOC family protein [Endomicrobium sp.]